MLSPALRWLTYLMAVLYAALGAALFLFSSTMASVFAWKVSPFVTMTIGGWCLGNAWLAWISARRWHWSLVYTGLIYLWLFGAFEAGVVIAFRDRLALGHPIAWLYLITLVVNLVSAAAGLTDWIRLRPTMMLSGPAPNVAHRAAVVAFVLFVGFLALYGMAAPIGAPGTRGGIFPEEMSLFTLRSFAAFYLSLALAAVPLLRARNLSTLLHHSIASYGLIVAITAAAFAHLHLFDFRERPGGLLYFGAYLIVGLPLLWGFSRLGTGAQHSSGRLRTGG
jgi:hypothetical protein